MRLETPLAVENGVGKPAAPARVAPNAGSGKRAWRTPTPHLSLLDRKVGRGLMFFGWDRASLCGWTEPKPNFVPELDNTNRQCSTRRCQLHRKECRGRQRCRGRGREAKNTGRPRWPCWRRKGQLRSQSGMRLRSSDATMRTACDAFGAK